MKRGDVIRVAAIEPIYSFYSGTADVTATEEGRVEVHFRAGPITRWCSVHGDTLTMLSRERAKFRWEHSR